MIISAFNNPATATRHEQAIGKMMASYERANHIAATPKRQNTRNAAGQLRLDADIARLLGHLNDHGPQSKPDLERALGLKRNSIANLVQHMTTRNLIVGERLGGVVFWGVAE